MSEADTIREAIRFSEDYGYNRWMDAADALTALERRAEQAEAHMADWQPAYDALRRRCEGAEARAEQAEAALRWAVDAMSYAVAWLEEDEAPDTVRSDTAHDRLTQALTLAATTPGEPE